MYRVAYLALCGYARTGGYVHVYSIHCIGLHSCIPGIVWIFQNQWIWTGLHTWHCVVMPEYVDNGYHVQGCIPGIVWIRLGY